MRRMPALAALTAAVALSLIAAPAALAATSPKFDVSPTLVRAGQRVTVTGKGCRSQAFVRIRLDHVIIERDVAGTNGRFKTLVEIPDRTGIGEHKVSVGCGRRNLGSTVIKVLKARFKISPRTVQAGDEVIVWGNGCRAGSLVSIRMDGDLIGYDRANSAGRFRKDEDIPGSSRGGRHVISARCGGKFLGSKSLRVIEAYPTPADLLRTSRTVVPAGQAVTISGDDCPTQTPVASLDGQPITLSVDRAGKGKGFSATAMIPSKTAPGRHRLWAACDAGSAGTTELQVLEPATIEPAAAIRAFGPQPLSDVALWVALFAGGTLLVASIRVGRRRRS